MRIFYPTFIAPHPRGAKNERLKAEKVASECNFAYFFRKKPTRRARSSCPRCQHSSSEITSARETAETAQYACNIIIFRIGALGQFLITLYIPRNIPEHETAEDPLYSERNSGKSGSSQIRGRLSMNLLWTEQGESWRVQPVSKYLGVARFRKPLITTGRTRPRRRRARSLSVRHL